jgi:hypothetical protein
MTENEQSLDEQFAFCENVVESLLKDQLGDSKNPQRNVIFNLKVLCKWINLGKTSELHWEFAVAEQDHWTPFFVQHQRSNWGVADQLDPLFARSRLYGLRFAGSSNGNREESGILESVKGSDNFKFVKSFLDFWGQLPGIPPKSAHLRAHQLQAALDWQRKQWRVQFGHRCPATYRLWAGGGLATAKGFPTPTNWANGECFGGIAHSRAPGQWWSSKSLSKQGCQQ